LKRRKMRSLTKSLHKARRQSLVLTVFSAFLHKARRLSLVLMVFSALTKYRVVKITRSSFEVVLRTMKHTMIYPSSGPSLEVIALCLVV
jgi:hypothetical protein